MRIPSGVVDQVVFFVALDSTDLKTRETGLTSFTVYRARNTGASTAMTTPTVAELSSANMPGVYSLLLDEDMTIDSGDDSQEMVFHITQASMAPVTRAIELYRPKLTAGETLTVASGVARANDASGNAVAPASATTAIETDTQDLQARTPAALVSGRMDSSVGAMAANVMTAAAAAADLTTELQSGLATAAALAVVDGIVDDILVDTGTTLDGRIPAALTVDGNMKADTLRVSGALQSPGNIIEYFGDTLTRLSVIPTLTGTVLTDGGNSVTSFKTDLTAAATDHFKDAFVKITGGALANQLREITGSTGTVDVVLTVDALTATPADGVTFEIVND